MELEIREGKDDGKLGIGGTGWGVILERKIRGRIIGALLMEKARGSQEVDA